MAFTVKESYGMSDLIEIMKMLRGENGCPWDKEQDHHSIRKNFLEEAYEAVEAIDKEDPELLREELGDVLLQVVFHAEMESEKGVFDFNDVCDEVCKKLVLRHPHVFGDVKVENSAEVLKNWDNIKQKSKEQETFTETLESVPKVQPALMRSYKILQRSERSGMINVKPSPLDMFIDNKDTIDKDTYSSLIGTTLMSFVNFARRVGVDPEEALNKACDSYIDSFRKVEDTIRLQGKEINSLSIDELNSLWEDAQKNNA